MGVYVYTMRNDILEVEGKKIARFSYAYKEGWGARSTRTASRLHTFAERARANHPEVELCIGSDSFKDAEKYELPIYKINRRSDCFLDQPKVDHEDGYRVVIVGYLVKEGRKYRVIEA